MLLKPVVPVSRLHCLCSAHIGMLTTQVLYMQMWEPAQVLGGGVEQTAYLQCLINAASIRQRLDEGGVGVLIGLHAAAARVKNASIACTAPQGHQHGGVDVS